MADGRFVAQIDAQINLGNLSSEVSKALGEFRRIREAAALPRSSLAGVGNLGEQVGASQAKLTQLRSMEGLTGTEKASLTRAINQLNGLKFTYEGSAQADSALKKFAAGIERGATAFTVAQQGAVRALNQVERTAEATRKRAERGPTQREIRADPALLANEQLKNLLAKKVADAQNNEDLLGPLGTAVRTREANTKAALRYDQQLLDIDAQNSVERDILSSREKTREEIRRIAELYRLQGLRARDITGAPEAVAARAQARVFEEHTRAKHEQAYLARLRPEDYALNADNVVGRQLRDLEQSRARRFILNSPDLSLFGTGRNATIGESLAQGLAEVEVEDKADAALRKRLVQEGLRANQKYVENTARAAEETRLLAAEIKARRLGLTRAAGEQDPDFLTRVGAEDDVRKQLDDLARKEARRKIRDTDLPTGGTIGDAINRSEGEESAAKKADSLARQQYEAEALAANKQYLQRTVDAAAAQSKLATAIDAQRLSIQRQNGEDDEAFARRVAAEKRLAEATERQAQNRAQERIVRQRESIARDNGDPDGILPTRFQRVQRYIATRQGGEYKDANQYQDLGQFFSSRLLTTAGFAASSAILYGGVSAITNTIQEAERLQRVLASVQAQFEALGQGDEFEGYREELLAIARETGVSGDEVVKVGLQFKGAFGDTTRAALETKAAIQGTVVTGLDLNEVVDGLTAASLSYGVSVSDIFDKALGIEQRFGVVAAESIKVLGDLAPVAKDAGLELNEVGAILGTIQKNSGRSGAAIAEGLGRVLPAIQSQAVNILQLYRSVPNLTGPLNDSGQPTTGRDAIEGIGNLIARGETGKVLLNLVENYDRLATSQKRYVIELLGGRREAQLLIPLFDNSSEALKELKSDLDDTGLAAGRYATVQATLGQALRRLAESGQQIGDALLRAGLGDILKDLTFIGSQLARVVGALGNAFATFNSALNGVPAKLLEIYAAYRLITALRGRGKVEDQLQLAFATGPGLNNARKRALQQAAIDEAGFLATQRRVAGAVAGEVPGAARSALGGFRDRYGTGRAAALQASPGLPRPYAATSGGLAALGIGPGILTLAGAAAVISSYNAQAEELDDALSAAKRRVAKTPTDFLRRQLDEYNSQSDLADFRDLLARNLFGEKGDAKRVVRTELKQRDIENFVPRLGALKDAQVIGDVNSKKQFGDLARRLKLEDTKEFKDLARSAREENDALDFQFVIDQVKKGDQAAVRFAEKLVTSNQLTRDELYLINKALPKNQRDQKLADRDGTLNRSVETSEEAARLYQEGRKSVQDYTTSLVGDLDIINTLVDNAIKDGDREKVIEPLLKQQASLRQSLDNIRKRGTADRLTTLGNLNQLTPDLALEITRQDSLTATASFNARLTSPEEVIASGQAFLAARKSALQERIGEARSAQEAYLEAIVGLAPSPEDVRILQALRAAQIQQTGQSDIDPQALLKLAPREEDKLRRAAVQERFAADQAIRQALIARTRDPIAAGELEVQGAQAGVDFAKAQQAENAANRQATVDALERNLANAKRRQEQLQQEIDAGGEANVSVVAPALKAAQDEVDEAQRKVDLARQQGAADEEKVAQAEAALTKSQIALADAKFAKAQAAREQAARNKDREGDPQEALRLRRINAEAALQKAKDENLGQAAIDQAQADLDSVALDERDYQRGVADSGRQLERAQTLDPIRQAEIDVAQARDDLERANKDERLRNQALAKLAEADRAYERALQDVINAKLDLQAIRQRAAGNDIGAAQTGLDKAQRDLDAAIAAGAGEAEIARLQGDVISAQADLTSTIISSTERQIDTDLTLGRISKAQAIARLQALRATVASRQHTQQELDDIDIKIKQLRDSSQQDLQFNLPTELGLPTLYETRRTGQLGGSAAYQDNRRQSIVLYINNGMDQQAAAQFLQESIGVTAPVNGAPRRY